MKFSIIMPSRLIPYRGCAKNLDKKLMRSIDAILSQSFKDFELIVIADGCILTKQIVKNYHDKRIILTECNHMGLWDNLPRNTGIDKATGEFIIYCDIDDWWGGDHLKIVNKHLGDYDFVWFNDYIFESEWHERACNIKFRGGCGTSNICYKRSLNIIWDRPGYSHDFYLIQKLLNVKNRMKIETPEYFVCHIPRTYDI